MVRRRALPIIKALNVSERLRVALLLRYGWGKKGTANMGDMKNLDARIRAGGDDADEIVRLREAIRRLADQDATLSVQEGNVTVTMDGTLTNEERAAIAYAVASLQSAGNYEISAKDALRKLLERTA